MSGMSRAVQAVGQTFAVPILGACITSIAQSVFLLLQR
jgi:hypothetical protein